MASVPFTISPAPGITNDLIAVIYNTLAPAAEVDRILKAAPHNNPYNFNFVNLVPGIYIVKIHETPDGVTLGTLRHDFWVDATLQKLLAYNILEIVVDRGQGAPFYDPSNGDIDYINPDIDGLTYEVFKPGYGILSWNADITPRTGGGFTFTNGTSFASAEIYTLMISNLVTQPISQTGVGFPDDVVTIPGDTVFSSAHYNKILEVDTGVEVINISIDLAAIPDATQFSINTQKHNNTLINVCLNLASGQTCLVNGRFEGSVYVGKGEDVTFFKKGSILRILTWNGDYRRIGEKIFSDGAPPSIPNILPFTGFWIDKARVPRLWNWYVSRLAPGQFVPGTDNVTPAGANITRWGIGTNMIWVPNYQNLHLRNNSGGQADNELQGDAVGDAEVNFFVFTGTGVGKNGMRNPAQGLGPLASYGDGGFVSSDSAGGTNNNNERTGTFSIKSPFGENRVKNVAVRGYVII